MKQQIGSKFLKRIHKNPKAIKWHLIIPHFEIPFELIQSYYLNFSTWVWDLIFKTQEFSNSELEWIWQETHFPDFWDLVSRYQKLDEQFIKKYLNNFDSHWHEIFYNQKLSENFIEEFVERSNWVVVYCRQRVSEDFILKNLNKIYSDHQKKKEIIYIFGYDPPLFHEKISPRIKEAWEMLELLQ